MAFRCIPITPRRRMASPLRMICPVAEPVEAICFGCHADPTVEGGEV